MQNHYHAARDRAAADAAPTPFTALVRCPECTSSRPMIIKALHPGLVADADRITYLCTSCGAEKTETMT
jgi:DNA-directed RNA polymerase subunit RPC12/RpoP